ncbi:MAG: winged helix-turn-helix transcriptional regulator, partial [Verrucomicrobia bacterium]|nr:winged helix-turn-helix transcriptional regulator [Cytophagales bacterium]
IVMPLEEEIQSRFQSKQQKAGVNLIFSGNWLSDRVSQMLRQHGITMQQFNTLRILRGALPEKVSVKYIRERMLDKMSDVSRVVEKLREKRFLVREECPEDRRNVNISITNKGLAKLTEIDRDLPKIDGIFSDFSESELDSFNTLLDKLRKK